MKKLLYCFFFVWNNKKVFLKYVIKIIDKIMLGMFVKVVIVYFFMRLCCCYGVFMVGGVYVVI